MNINEVRLKREALELQILAKNYISKKEAEQQLEKTCLNVMKKFYSAVPNHVLHAILEEVKVSFKKDF